MESRLKDGKKTQENYSRFKIEDSRGWREAQDL